MYLSGDHGGTVSGGDPLLKRLRSVCEKSERTVVGLNGEEIGWRTGWKTGWGNKSEIGGKISGRIDERTGKESISE